MSSSDDESVSQDGGTDDRGDLGDYAQYFSSEGEVILPKSNIDIDSNPYSFLASKDSRSIYHFFEDLLWCLALDDLSNVKMKSTELFISLGENVRDNLENFQAKQYAQETVFSVLTGSLNKCLFYFLLLLRCYNSFDNYVRKTWPTGFRDHINTMIRDRHNSKESSSRASPSFKHLSLDIQLLYVAGELAHSVGGPTRSFMTSYLNSRWKNPAELPSGSNAMVLLEGNISVLISRRIIITELSCIRRNTFRMLK